MFWLHVLFATLLDLANAVKYWLATNGVLRDLASVVTFFLLQVLTLLADYNGSAVCILVVSMTTKRFGLYKLAFAKFQEVAPAFRPTVVMADFELGMRKAFGAVFTHCIIIACR